MSLFKLSCSLFLLSLSCFHSGMRAAAKTPVSQEQFEAMKHYWRVALTAVPDDCPTPPRGITILKRFDDRPTDTEGLLARDELRNELIVAFRPSTSIRDFAAEAQDMKLVPYESPGIRGCNNCLVRNERLKRWNSVAGDTITSVQSALQQFPGAKVIVVGHSTGGDMMPLAAMSLVGNGIPVTGYAFGASRVGNKEFADFVDRQSLPRTMFRVVNMDDASAHITTPEQGYRHHSTEFWEQTSDYTAATTFRCDGQEAPDCSLTKKNKGIFGSGLTAAHFTYFGVNFFDPRICGLSIVDVGKGTILQFFSLNSGV
ncbi:hypothetical protein HIM_02177 [Hirsutella minnesotensis 3608]|nr:hypothetical protein HIM_02177 [Hirsutella minnesotensis 3608]